MLIASNKKTNQPRTDRIEPQKCSFIFIKQGNCSIMEKQNVTQIKTFLILNLLNGGWNYSAEKFHNYL